LLSSKSGPRRHSLGIVGQVEIIARQQIMGPRRIGMVGGLSRPDFLLGANLKIGALVFRHVIPPDRYGPVPGSCRANAHS
jgi:hypothetical protein